MCDAGMPKQGKIYSALADIMAAMEAVEKKRSASGGLNYAFRSIDDVMAEVNRHLKTARVFAVPEIVTENAMERQTNKGGVMLHRLVTVKYHFTADDGSFITATGAGEAMDSGDKAISKAMAMAFKYILTQMFCIPTEGDNDPDSTVHEIKADKPESNPEPPKSNGSKWPLTSQLLKVKDALKLDYDDVDEAVRQALKLKDRREVPKLKEIQEPNNQKTVFAFLLKFASEKYVATGVLTEWVKGKGFDKVLTFAFDKDGADACTISDMEELYTRMHSVESETTKPIWSNTTILGSYTAMGITQKELEAALNSSVQNWGEDERALLTRAFQEAREGKHENLKAALATVLA